MQHSYLEATGVVRRFGKPDLFNTMTANHSSPEITAALRYGESAANRPDIFARAFRMKPRALLDKQLKGHALGNVVGYMWVIEFQKRGLPHAHILIIAQHTTNPRH